MLGARWALLAAALLGVSQAVPSRLVPAGHVVHEKRDLDRPSPWVKRSRLDTSAILPVRIGLIQNNLHKGHDLLMELSHPDSPKYGQWWSAEDVHSFFAPAAETVELVKTWITSVGITSDRIVHSENKGWLAVDATVEEAELLFKTTFHEYEHNSLDEGVRVGTDSYHVPEHISPHIDYVTPGLRMARVKKRTIEWKKSAMKRKEKAEKREDTNVAVGGDSMGKNSLKDSMGKGSTAGSDNIRQYLPPLTPAQAALPYELQPCSYISTPDCIRASYGLPREPPAIEGQSVGTFELGLYFDQPDLDSYFSTYAQWVPNGTQPIPALINGAQYNTFQNDTENVDGEPLIDIGIMQALVYPQNVTLYQVDDPNQSKLFYHQVGGRKLGFNTFLDALDGSYCTYEAYGISGNDPEFDAVYPNPNTTASGSYQGQLMCGTYKPTNVISISYGQAEADLPANYQKRECDEFLKLGLQGVSVVVASGDDGVAASKWDPKPNGCLGPDHIIFNPGHPGTCPYVTTVGGTARHYNQTILDPEIVWAGLQQSDDDPAPKNVSSGGGFSNVFPIPDYQQDAVKYFFDNYDPGYPYYSQLEPDFDTVQGLYNRIGRGTPDISATAVNFPFFITGLEGTTGGTSGSAPVVAAVLTLLNQERASIGKGPIGLINPVIYAHPEILNDITSGHTFGCGTNGFPAVPKWDPATGLGTPNYQKMRDLWLSLP